VLGIVRTATVAYGGRGVRANAVVLGIIDTPFMHGLVNTATGGEPMARTALIRGSSPAARAAASHEVAGVVAFLASDTASFVNGALVTVGSGF